MKRWNHNKKGVRLMPLALILSIGAVFLCVLTAKHYEK